MRKQNKTDTKITKRVEELQNMIARQEQRIGNLRAELQGAESDRIAMLGGLQELQSLATEK